MKISYHLYRIYGKTYKVKSYIDDATSLVVKDMVNHIRQQTKKMSMEGFYTVFLITMYLISSSILKELSDGNIQSIIREKSGQATGKQPKKPITNIENM